VGAGAWFVWLSEVISNLKKKQGKSRSAVLLGHTHLAITRPAGDRRVYCHASSLSAVRRLSADPTLTLYRVVRRWGSRTYWLCIYDRRAER
jgi:hypothetical protein